MTMLTRFRQSGGFLKLLLLVESCDGAKQRHLLELVAQEDPGWAHLLRLKTLNAERILSWPEPLLGQIWATLPLQLVIALWQKSPTQMREKIERSLPRSYQTSFRKGIDDTPVLDDAEVATARLRLVSHVRELSQTGTLQFRDFDPGLVLNGPLSEHFEPFKKVA